MKINIGIHSKECECFVWSTTLLSDSLHLRVQTHICDNLVHLLVRSCTNINKKCIDVVHDVNRIKRNWSAGSWLIMERGQLLSGPRSILRTFISEFRLISFADPFWGRSAVIYINVLVRIFEYGWIYGIRYYLCCVPKSLDADCVSVLTTIYIYA